MLIIPKALKLLQKIAQIHASTLYASTGRHAAPGTSARLRQRQQYVFSPAWH
ncbi:MAG: hypothetical protein R3F42_14620 [Pseudomonadota bacterium]